MKKMLLIIIGMLCLLGNSTLSFSQAQNSQYEQEKVVLEKAKSIGTVEALDTFLERYPNSSWKDGAIYERDKAALEKAKSIGTVEGP